MQENIPVWALSSTLRLHEETLPPYEAFYDSFHNRLCTTADYDFAKKAWDKGGSKNGKDHCRTYLASVILTLLDIVCKNTDKLYEEFGLENGK